MISKNKLFIFFSIFSLLGIFFNNLLCNFKIVLLVLFFLIILFLQFYIFTKKNFLFGVIIFLGFLFGIIVSHYNLKEVNYKELLINKYLGNGKHKLVFEVNDIYKIKEFNTEYNVTIKKINNENIIPTINAIISIPINFDLQKGYIIEVNDKINNFKSFNDFEYKKYMISKNIYFKTFSNNYKIIKKKKLNLIQNNIIKIRYFFLRSIKKIYPSDEAVFLGGILLGARKDINSELKQNFNNSGLTHFIAVSGFNITILILFLSYLIKFFPVYIKNIIISFSILFFTLLVGDTAPVVRASIMGLIGYYIISSGRKPNSLSIILLTATIMVVFSPFSLNYDVSLHLSFLATIGIIYTQGFWGKIFYFLPNFLEIKTAFVLCLASLTFTLPIIIFNFGQFSILAPISNILVAWTIPLAMLFGFLSIIFYSISNILGIVIGYLAWILLKWDIIMVNIFGNIKWSIIKIDFGINKYYYELLYFIILIFLIIWFRKKELCPIENKNKL